MVEPYYVNDVTIASVLPRARAAAERAVALDDGLAEAHQALGYIYTESFEWAKAEPEGCSRTASVLGGMTSYAGVRASRRSRRSSISM